LQNEDAMSDTEETLAPMPVTNGPTLTDAIRSAMRRCSLPALSRASGVAKMVLVRFLAGQQVLTLADVERILEALRCTVEVRCDLPADRRLVRLKHGARLKEN
jgi:hypothetical protein